MFASNATSPEVGGDLVEYCESWNVGELAILLIRFEQDENLRRDLQNRAKQFIPKTWGQMIKDVPEKSVPGRT